MISIRRLGQGLRVPIITLHQSPSAQQGLDINQRIMGLIKAQTPTRQMHTYVYIRPQSLQRNCRLFLKVRLTLSELWLLPPSSPAFHQHISSFPFVGGLNVGRLK